MKHTKGPLKIGTVFNEVNQIIPKVFDSKGPSFILVDGSDSDSNMRLAQLIAAAPEMLEELSQLLDALENKILKTDSKTLTEEMIYSIKTKLNKAKGQE